MRRGFSLLEVVVALGLAALILPLMLELLPTSALALQRAEDLQTATGVAVRAMDQMRADPRAGNSKVELNRTVFTIVTEVHDVRPGVVDLVVRVTDERQHEVRLATRARRSEE